MYKLVLGLRYLRGRLITVASVLFVALGVMTLIVANSVMGGFLKVFRERLRGTLSHLTVAVYGADSVDAVAQRVAATEHVAAVAPRKVGLVLLAVHGQIEACQITGIVPAREYRVSQLERYLMRPYDDLEDELEHALEPPGATLRWTLDGVWEYEGKSVLFVSQTGRVAGREATEVISLTFGDHGRVDFVERGLHADKLPADRKRQGTAEFDRWRPWVAQANELLAAEDVKALLTRFDRPTLSHNRDPLDRAKPFVLAGGATPQRFPGLVVGIELYRKLKLERGMDVELISARYDGKTRELRKVGRRFTVTGTFKSGMTEYDAMFLYADLGELRTFLDPRRGNVLGVALDDFQRAEEVAAGLRLTDDGLRVETWEDKRATLMQAVVLERRIMFVILSLFIFFAMITVAVILILLVAEKTRDIGILLAVGATPRGIRTIFIANGLFLGLVGCLLGVVAGIALSLNVNEIADWIHELTGFRVFPRDVYFLDRIPSDLDPVWILYAVGVTVVLCYISCWLPARRAARLQVVDTLNWE